MEALKILNKIAYRVHINQVFSDFLQIVVSAFCKGSDESNYKNSIRNYNDEEKSLFSHALGALILDYEKISSVDGNWGDVIGNIFEEVNSKHTASYNGQFFTPLSICNLMAEMHRDKEGESVCDPSCGSSRNLIAHSRLNYNNRFKYFYSGYDLDLRCCLMSVINFLMYGLKGVIIHANTLTLEIFKGWRIYAPETGLFVQPISAEQCKNYIKSEKTINEQLKLF